MGAIRLLALAIIATGVLSIELPEKPDTQPLSWWQEEVVYQVYPRSHQDTNGDGIGDLKGIQDRLQHFVDLGVGSVWISPIYKSPMADFGYDISDFRDIDPMFGTLADFRSLSKAMKDKGIKLIMDFVPNHTSDQHPWFQLSIAKKDPFTDYYIWKDAKWVGEGENRTRLPPNNWRSVFGRSAWEWNDRREQYYLHQFTIGQPDLDFNNELVKNEILEAVRFWLEEGVDGFRVDAVPHIFEDPNFYDEPVNPNPPPNADCDIDHACLIHNGTYNLPEVFPLLASFRKLMDVYTARDGQDKVMMVESTVPGLENLFEYYGTTDAPIAHYPFNFEFINRIKPGFNGTDINGLVTEWFEKMPEGNTANWLLGNHDNSRVGSRFSTDVIDPFNMINLLLPGSAVTYYGEEIGMVDAKISYEDTVDPPACDMGPDRYEMFSRDPERTPMQWNGHEKNAGFSEANKPWLPMHENWETVNVEDSWNSPSLSHIQVYKSTMELRKTDSWRFGSMESKSLQNGDLFGFTRIHKTRGFVYLANFAATAKTINVTQEFKGIPTDAGKVYVYLTSVDFTPDTEIGSKVDVNATTVGAKHAIILRWDDNSDPPFTTTTRGPIPTRPTTTTTTTAGTGEPSTTEGDGGEGTTTTGRTTTAGAASVGLSIVASVLSLAVALISLR